PAPPRYAFEPWIDVINEGEGEAAPNGQGFSGGERVREDLEMIARKARETNTPIGTLGVEGWQDVPGGPELFDQLRDEGYHLSAYWNMFTSEGTEAYEEAKAKDIFVKDPAGNDYPIVTNRQGISFLIDYSHPDAQDFWKGQLDRSNELGFEAFMHDFGELITEGMRFHNGELPPEMHNHYPVLYHRTARRAVDAYAADNPDHEPFFYVRAGYSGVGDEPGVIAYTPSVFPGDETTDWAEGSGIPSVPPAMLNLAMGGSFAFTTDVGGYLDLLAPPTSKELFIRWSQLAALTPISRIHNSTGGGSRYPWSFDDETVGIYRRYARAKVELIPLVERWSERASEKGDIGPVRPLVLDDSSPEARSIDDEWLLGKNILAAPVLTEGAREREVYLPRGSRWRQVTVAGDGSFRAAGESQDGGETVTAEAPLADIPLFVRAGTAQDPGGDAPGGGAGGGGDSDGGSDGAEDGDSDGGSVEGDSSGSDAADDAATGTTGGSLPFTGLGLGAMALLAVALIAVGLGARLPASRGK
ncbi:MAG: TIM-barrel domain-containing protein, partial [Solirubrobacterales bacterium]